MTVIRRQIAELAPVAGQRLGRHVEHDDRSRNFPAPVAGVLRTTLHHRHARIFDQGDLGSCTGNAMAGIIGTDPYWRGSGHANEVTAITLYEKATALDDIGGTYPPDDTGSTGLAVAKAAQQMGMISSYGHAFGIQHALAALVLSPVITGINWYDSFDQPGPHGLIAISADAQVRGGHEVEILGLDVDARTIRGANSWGSHWADHGHFAMGFDTWARLLDEQGDVTTFA